MQDVDASRDGRISRPAGTWLMISQINQSAACQNLATQLMRLRWLDFGNFMLQTPAPPPILGPK